MLGRTRRQQNREPAPVVQRKQRRLIAFREVKLCGRLIKERVRQKAKGEVEKAIPASLDKNGSVYDMVTSGARGSLKQITQMAGMKGLIASVSGETIEFRAGETIHTENSYKYSIDEFDAMAAVAGFDPVGVWTDPAAYFAVALYVRREFCQFRQ